MLKKFALISALVMLPAALLAQSWPNLPIIGAPSYSCGSVNAVSNCTVPAGPAITGNETVPVDTNLSNGAQPQTAKISLPALGAGVTVVSVPVTTDTLTVASTTRQLIVNPA